MCRVWIVYIKNTQRHALTATYTLHLARTLITRTHTNMSQGYFLGPEPPEDAHQLASQVMKVHFLKKVISVYSESYFLLAKHLIVE